MRTQAIPEPHQVNSLEPHLAELAHGRSSEVRPQTFNLADALSMSARQTERVSS
jgi:hypothetical protein